MNLNKKLIFALLILIVLVNSAIISTDNGNKKSNGNSKGDQNAANP
jgi:hypothetical protein